MADFAEVLARYDWDREKAEIYQKTTADVERALQRESRDLDDFKALISPAAEPYLEAMAQLSHWQTCQRFGRTISMYVPLYLSNACQNICSYCGFAYNLNVPRKTLTEDEAVAEVKALTAQGFRHLLLVTGEVHKVVATDYFVRILDLIREQVPQISLEVQPLAQDEYARLADRGVTGVFLYRETYDRTAYREHHHKGRKRNFEWRLGTPERIAAAGMHKVGLGVLLGLSDWRADSLCCARHLRYLQRRYWRTKYSVSFPRLRPSAADFASGAPITDAQLVQLICAYRLQCPQLELSMSTRESATFRDHSVKLGVTHMSAGSKTAPGGYSGENNEAEQFEIADHRLAAEIAQMIQNQGYEPVWKDWDRAYAGETNLMTQQMP